MMSTCFLPWAQVYRPWVCFSRTRVAAFGQKQPSVLLDWPA